MNKFELIENVLQTLTSGAALEEVKVRWEVEVIISVQWRESPDRSVHLAKVEELTGSSWPLQSLDGKS